LKNFTFKVIPNQADIENIKQPKDKDFCSPKKECPKQEISPIPCPPCPPKEPIPCPPCPPKESMPCPPKESMPCPPMPMPSPCPPQEPIHEEPMMPCPPMPCPQMPCPCPPMEPMCPQMPCPCPPMPCPFGESGMMMPICPPHSGHSAPPFTCPYFRLAHAYVPWQCLNTVYSPAEALCNGTLFPELNMPQGQYGPCEGPRPCKVYFGGGVPHGCK
jgi:hypothetical protein